MVKVLPDEPGVARWRRPHLRVPGYVFGAVGVVERLVGSFGDPEFLAFRGSAAEQPLYRVRFTQAALGWSGEGEEEAGTAPSTVEVEVYGSWLEAASPHELDAADAAPPAVPAQPAADCNRAHEHARDHGHGHDHDHGHSHGHGHGPIQRYTHPIEQAPSYGSAVE